MSTLPKTDIPPRLFTFEPPGGYRVPPGLARWLPWAVLAAMVVAFGMGFSYLSIQRHLAFQSHAFDLANMDQAVWATLHGNLFGFTDMAVGSHILTTRVAIHVEPFLLAAAGLYWFHAGVETLLVLQAVVVSLGAIPAYLIARDALGRAWLGLAFPAAYLLHPSVQNAVLDDFHAVTLSAAFLLWALYFLLRDSMAPFAVFCVLAASTKEEVGLVVAAMGLFLLFRRRWYAGFMTVVCGTGWFLVSVLMIIPAFNPSGSPYLGRYAYLGKGLGGIVSGLIHHPSLVAHTLGSTARLQYLTDLLHPIGFVGLVGLPILLLATPALLINTLSADARMYSGFYQYSAEIIPFLIGAAAVGVGMVSRAARRLNAPRATWMAPILCGLVLIASVVDTREYGFSPLSRDFAIPDVGTHQTLEDQLLSAIPPTAVVAAADEIVPHLSERSWIYLLPTVHPQNGPVARYVVLDASIPSEPILPRTLHTAAVGLLRSGYGVVAARDGILILRRGARQRRLPDAFFSFAYGQGSPATSLSAGWGSLQLLGVTIHPGDGNLNRSRPAVGIDMYWRLAVPTPAHAKVTVYLSPVYSGDHPTFSSRWMAQSDSPTLDWLPTSAWPAGRIVFATVPPLVPQRYMDGSVDVAIGVSGLGPLRDAPPGEVVGDSQLLRVATLTVDRVGA